MSSLMKIPAESFDGLIKYEPKYTTVCTIGKLPFHGTVEILYEPEKSLLEFMEFEKWLSQECKKEPHTIESLCSKIFDMLTDLLDPISMQVQVNARTKVHAPVSATIAKTKRTYEYEAEPGEQAEEESQ